MKIIITISILGLFLFSSCNDGKPSIDRGLMQKVLYDMHIAEVKARFVDSNKTLANEVNPEILMRNYKSILDKHKINVEDFRKAMKWYTEHPLVLDTIYQKMIDSTSINKPSNEVNIPPQNVIQNNR